MLVHCPVAFCSFDKDALLQNSRQAAAAKAIEGTLK
jgi:hypothetical protein